MNTVDDREQDGRFAIRWARCETTLVDPFNPPGADGKNSKDGEQVGQR